jgi:zinc D-Ala-D-Ala dipeptidase
MSEGQPIPALRVPTAWQRIPLRECGEPLIPLSTYAPTRVAVDPRYHTAGYLAAVPECYAREGVARAVLQAATTLPPGWRLVVFDAWRPLAVQLQLYDGYRAALRQAHSAATDAWLTAETQRYVALPSADPACPSPHATGGAIDLSLLDAAGAPLDMGTPFDAFDPHSHTRYFERLLEQGRPLGVRETAHLRHRRLLFHALVAAGFTNYPEEWWHFEYGRSQYGPLMGLEDWRVVGRDQSLP